MAKISLYIFFFEEIKILLSIFFEKNKNEKKIPKKQQVQVNERLSFNMLIVKTGFATSRSLIQTKSCLKDCAFSRQKLCFLNTPSYLQYSSYFW